MNYIQLKRKTFFTTQYPLLQFSSDIEILNEIIAGLLALPAIYITSFIDNVLSVSVPLRNIPSEIILVAILSNLDIDCDIDNSLISEPISPKTLSIPLNINVDTNISNARKFKSDISIHCNIFSSVYIPPPLLKMLIFMLNEFDFKSNSVLSESAAMLLNEFDFIAYSSCDIQIGSTLLEIFNTIFLNISFWNVTLSVLDYLRVYGVIANETFIESAISIFQTIPLKCDIHNEFSVSASLDIVRVRQLKDIDDFTLSMLDNQTLYEIAYNFKI